MLYWSLYGGKELPIKNGENIMNKKTYAKIKTQINYIKSLDVQNYDAEKLSDCILKIRESFVEAVGRNAVVATAKLLGVPVVQVYQWSDKSCMPRRGTALSLRARLSKSDRQINKTLGM